VGEKCFDKFRPRIRLPRNSRDLLHAANLRHGTDGFTSPPKGGVLRIFSPLKIRRLRPGLNPRTWVPKASTLPLDHRSRYQRKKKLLEFSKFSVLFTYSLVQASILGRKTMLKRSFRAMPMILQEASYVYIQGVPGGRDKTSGECSLC